MPKSQSFKRHCNSFTIPTYLYSDNAKQFLASKNFLAKALVSDEFKEFMLEHSIRHETIFSYASWQGGLYERVLGCMKRQIAKCLGRAKVGYFELITLLSDIQLMINNRPITYQFSEIDEIEPLNELEQKCYLLLFGRFASILRHI